MFGVPTGGINTMYRSDDLGASWVQITDATHMYATIQTITGDPRIYGRVYFGTNGLGIFYGDIAGTVSATNTPTPTSNATKTNTPLPSNTPTKTNTPVVVPSNTPTNVATATKTNTPSASLTPSKTNTPGATATKTNTPVATATKTNTVAPSLTPTSGGTGGTCSPVNATITAPFTFDGAGTLCWKSNSLGTYINFWNTNTPGVTVNGVALTGYTFVTALPPKAADGYWYIVYSASSAYGHFEAK
jgi:hypothetical protein